MGLAGEPVAAWKRRGAMTSMNFPSVSLGAGLGYFFEVHVVYEPEAEGGNADLVVWLSDVLVAAGGDLVVLVSAEHGDVSLFEPGDAGHMGAGPGVGGVGNVAVIVAGEVAGADEEYVSGFHADIFSGLGFFEHVGGDGEGGLDAVDAPEPGDVEEDAPGDDALGEEGYGLGFCAIFAVHEVGGMAVVHLAADEDVAKGVDVGDAVSVIGPIP